MTEPDDILKNFIGRRKELDALKKHFHRDRQVAFITGPRGAGKTSLAYMFSHLSESMGLFPGGSKIISAENYPSPAVKYLKTELFPKILKKRTLIIVDDFDLAPIELYRYFLLDAPRSNNISVIFSGIDEPADFKPALRVKLGGFTQEEFFHLLQNRVGLSNIDPTEADKLYNYVLGHPIYADIAGNAIKEHIVSLKEFLKGLREFQHPGILCPNGKPITVVPNQIQIETSDTNKKLLNKLRTDPQEMWNIPSRRFEEIVAEMLTEQGYEIELTPSTKDGGFDLYAARKEGLGSFLYLVECKRYTPPNKVGVSVVRALHGVVHQKQANGGVVVTSSFFTKGAKEFQRSIPYQIQLNDYMALQKWIGIL